MIVVTRKTQIKGGIKIKKLRFYLAMGLLLLAGLAVWQLLGNPILDEDIQPNQTTKPDSSDEEDDEDDIPEVDIPPANLEADGYVLSVRKGGFIIAKYTGDDELVLLSAIILFFASFLFGNDPRMIGIRAELNSPDS